MTVYPVFDQEAPVISTSADELTQVLAALEQARQAICDAHAHEHLPDLPETTDQMYVWNTIARLDESIKHIQNQLGSARQKAHGLNNGQVDQNAVDLAYYAECVEPAEEIADKARQAAREQYQEDGWVEIDDNAAVSCSLEGCYVQAWVFVPAGAPGEDVGL